VAVGSPDPTAIPFSARSGDFMGNMKKGSSGVKPAATFPPGQGTWRALQFVASGFIRNVCFRPA